MTDPSHPSGRSLVDDVRLFGLVSADMVVDRYVRMADGALGTLDGGTAAPRVDAAAQVAAGLGGAWLRVVEATAALADRVPGEGASAGRLDLPTARPGATVEGSVWVHNTTATAVPVDLGATTLAAAGGRALPAEAVSVDPARLDRLPAQSSAEVRIRVRVPEGQAPGRYQGLVLTSAAPDPVLLRVDVRGSGEPDR